MARGDGGGGRGRGRGRGRGSDRGAGRDRGGSREGGRDRPRGKGRGRGSGSGRRPISNDFSGATAQSFEEADFPDDVLESTTQHVPRQTMGCATVAHSAFVLFVLHLQNFHAGASDFNIFKT